MGVVDRARAEMKLAKMDDEDVAAMVDILERFFSRWDSGGAVWAMAPVLQKLISGQCLTPLTGNDDEWNQVGEGVFQNRRMSTVFKDSRFHEGKFAYDLDNPRGSIAAIQFPYTPDYEAKVADPVLVLSSRTLTSHV